MEHDTLLGAGSLDFEFVDLVGVENAFLCEPALGHTITNSIPDIPALFVLAAEEDEMRDGFPEGLQEIIMHGSVQAFGTTPGGHFLRIVFIGKSVQVGILALIPFDYLRRSDFPLHILAVFELILLL